MNPSSLPTFSRGYVVGSLLKPSMALSNAQVSIHSSIMDNVAFLMTSDISMECPDAYRPMCSISLSVKST